MSVEMIRTTTMHLNIEAKHIPGKVHVVIKITKKGRGMAL
jgi:hypothetical protein